MFDSVGNTLLQNHLLDANQDKLVPGVDIRVVLAAGMTAFRDLVLVSSLLDLYDDALRKVFVEAIPMAGLAFVAILGVEWKSVHREKERGREVGRGGGVGRRLGHKISHRSGGCKELMFAL